MRKHLLTRVVTSRLMVGLALTNAPVACDASGATANLTLDAQWIVPFPDSTAVSRVRTDGHGRFLAWSGTSDTLLEYVGEAWRARVPSSRAQRLLAADYEDDSAISAVLVERTTRDDSARTLLVRLTAEDRSAAVVVPVAAVRAAVSGKGRWYLASLTRDSTLQLFAWHPGDTARPILQLGTATGVSTHPPRISLSAEADQLLVTQTDSPFHVLRVDAMGRQRPTMAPLADPRVRAAMQSPSRALWMSLPALKLGNAMLQTLSDLRSTRRVLILSDRAGRVVSVRALETPLGFVDSDQAARLLCGVRTVDRREVICYRWQVTLPP